MNAPSRLAAWLAVAVVAVALLCPAAAERGGPQPPGRLRVMAYNVQHLPIGLLNKRPQGAYRARQQVACCAAYDLVGLNEVFDLERRQAMLVDFQRLWRPECFLMLPAVADRSAFGLDSGLLLASRKKIVAEHRLRFGNDSTWSDAGLMSDGYAAKGALHARIVLAPGVGGSNGEALTCDVFVTHLESRSRPRREEQYRLLARFMGEHCGADRPLLLLGDLNTAGDPADVASSDSAYARLRKALGEVRKDWIDTGLTAAGPRGTSSPESPAGGRRIDYIWLSNPATGRPLRVISAGVERCPDPRVGFLSDHSAVTAELCF